MAEAKLFCIVISCRSDVNCAWVSIIIFEQQQQEIETKKKKKKKQKRRTIKEENLLQLKR